MPTGSITIDAQIAGVVVHATIDRTEEGGIHQQISLPAGSAGTLSTRTDDDTGVCSVASGHGLIVSDTVDVYWSGGMRNGMNVSAVSGDDVTVDVGSGDNLPTQDAAVVVTEHKVIDVDFDGDQLEILVASCNKRCHLEFTTDADASIKAVEIPAGEARMWFTSDWTTNPLAGQVVGKILATCGHATEAGSLKIGGLYDSA